MLRATIEQTMMGLSSVTCIVAECSDDVPSQLPENIRHRGAPTMHEFAFMTRDDQSPDTKVQACKCFVLAR